jgi:hypothetical protein
VHLGGTDFHGLVAADPGDAAFDELDETLWEAFPTAPIARLLRLVDSELGPDGLEGEEFGLDQVLPQGRRDLVSTVFSDLADRFHAEYARLYQDHRRILEMLTASGFELPLPLRAAGEVTLSMELAAQLEQARKPNPRLFTDTSMFDAVRDTIDRARQLGLELELHPVADALTGAVTRAVEQAIASLDEDTVTDVERWLSLCAEMGVTIDLSAAQERLWSLAGAASVPSEAELALLQRLGTELGFAPTALASG